MTIQTLRTAKVTINSMEDRHISIVLHGEGPSGGQHHVYIEGEAANALLAKVGGWLAAETVVNRQEIAKLRGQTHRLRSQLNRLTA